MIIDQAPLDHQGFAPANYFSGYFSIFTLHYRNFRNHYRFYWYCS